MSFFVWLLFRITQKTNSKVSTYSYVVGIAFSSIIFSAGHLPAAVILSPNITLSLLTFIMVGNSLFGFKAGYLYWKRGLESAILAHMLVHAVMLFVEKIS